MVLGMISVIALLATPAPDASPEPDSLVPELEVFRPFVGTTWRGSFEGASPNARMQDVSRWERALNGRAIRILHSLNDGEYGGESIVMWDREKGTLTFHYFTTAGFWTQGTMTREEGGFASHEFVSGSSGGITEVRSVSTTLPGGRMSTRSEYLRNGQWVPGHSVTYVQDPTATVVFR
jgi:hypothetical protein